jgi:hypothetical protein
MSNAVERLRASKEKSDHDDYQFGRTLGKAWAEHRAQFPELQRLDDLYQALEAETNYCWDWYFEEQSNSAYGVDELLFFEMHPEADKDRRESQEFWESVLGDAIHTAADYVALVKGFAEGALEYWWSVEDEL